MYLLRDLRFFFVAQRHYGQHQVDEVERSEEHDNGEERHAHWTARRQHLEIISKKDEMNITHNRREKGRCKSGIAVASDSARRWE